MEIITHILDGFEVGMTGFEPATPSSLKLHFAVYSVFYRLFCHFIPKILAFLYDLCSFLHNIVRFYLHRLIFFFLLVGFW